MMNWFGPPKVKTVAVSLKTGSTVIGAMVSRSRDLLILRGAVLIGVDRNQQETRDRVDGDVVIPAINVDYWQEGLDPAFVATLGE